MLDAKYYDLLVLYSLIMGELDRARKICEIALSRNISSTNIQFVYNYDKTRSLQDLVDDLEAFELTEDLELTALNIATNIGLEAISQNKVITMDDLFQAILNEREDIPPGGVKQADLKKKPKT